MLLTWTAAEVRGVSPLAYVGVEFDASMQETLTFSSTATRHPVEEDADITDHVSHEPDVLTCTGLITNAPVGVKSYTDGNVFGPTVSVFLPKTWRTTQRRNVKPGTVRGFWNSPFIPPGAPPRAFSSPGVFVPGESVLVPETYSHAVLQTLQPVNRVQTVIDMLRAARQSRAVIRVDAKHGTFEQMVLVGLTVPAMAADAVEISLTLQSLSTARVGTTTVTPKRRPPTKRVGDQAKAETGQAPAAYFDATGAEVDRTVLDAAVKYAAELVGS